MKAGIKKVQVSIRGKNQALLVFITHSMRILFPPVVVLFWRKLVLVSNLYFYKLDLSVPHPCSVSIGKMSNLKRCLAQKGVCVESFCCWSQLEWVGLLEVYLKFYRCHGLQRNDHYRCCYHLFSFFFANSMDHFYFFWWEPPWPCTRTIFCFCNY